MPAAGRLQRFWFGLGKPLLLVGLLSLGWGLVLVSQAPLEALQGPPQKIFYLHVPLAWAAFILFGGVFVAGIMYLVRKIPFWDQAGHGLAAAGFAALTAVLVTGPIWAKPIWGTWWVWEPRLTTTFILWCLFAAYHLIRLTRGNDGWTARVCAVLGIFAFADIPIIHLSVLWWRTLHPAPVVLREGDVGGGLDPSMRLPLLVMFLALLALGLATAALRGRLRVQEDAIEEGAL